MKWSNRFVSFAMLMMMLAAGFASLPARTAMAQDPVTSAGFVSEQWRILALQTVVTKDFAAAELEPNPEGEWALVVADVTNLGASGAFDPASLTLGTTTDSPLTMTDGVAADPALTASATKALAFEGAAAEAGLTVAENSNLRVAFVFSIDAAPAGDETLVLRHGDQVMSLDNTVVPEYSAQELPAHVPTMELQLADITNVPGRGQLDVTFRDGESTRIGIAGITTPYAQGQACYAPESSTAVTQVTGGTVWLEQDAESDEYLVWANDAAAGTFVLLNHELVAQGAAGVDEDSAQAYASWLGATANYAKDSETGLWSLCRDAGGSWINPPTPTPPTPVPTQSPQEIRGEYATIDYRDLVIRPMEFQGEQITFQGSVFNIDVDGNTTAMQIWIEGSNEAVVVAYEGDTHGIYDGTWVTVYGTGAGTFEGTNGFGGIIVQPVVVADIVDF